MLPITCHKTPSLLTTDRGVFRYRYSAHLHVAGRAGQSDHKTRIRGNRAARPPTGRSRSADPPLPPLASARRRYFTGPGRPSPPMRRRSTGAAGYARRWWRRRRAPVDQRTVIPSAACYANWPPSGRLALVSTGANLIALPTRIARLSISQKRRHR